MPKHENTLRVDTLASEKVIQVHGQGLIGEEAGLTGMRFTRLSFGYPQAAD